MTTTEHRGAVLAVMCAGMFLVLLDVTVVNVAVPSIESGLHTGVSGIQWVVDAYTVAIASGLLTGGAAGDRFGHRRLVLAGLVGFGAASLACSLARSTALLVASRAVQGAGAALLLPGSIAVIAAAFPDEAQQARALGIWAGFSSLALPAGPLLGGAIVSGLGWRWVFGVNAPVVALALAATLFLVAPGSTRHHRPLDWPGGLTAMVALAAAVYAVIVAGHDRRAGAPIAAASVAVVAGVAFVAHERRAPSPLLPLGLFRRPLFSGVTAVALAMNLATNGTLFVATLYLQGIRHHPALTAGGMLLPLFVPLAVLAPLAGRVTARWGARPPIIAGAAVAAVGALGLLFVGVSTPYVVLLGALAGLGIGAGLVTAPVVAAALQAVPAGRSGLASGINNTARQTGTALGVAIFGAVAGSTSAPHRFVTGLHHLAVLGAGLWASALVVAVFVLRPREPARRRRTVSAGRAPRPR